MNIADAVPAIPIIRLMCSIASCEHMVSFDRLCASLQISGWTRWRCYADHGHLYADFRVFLDTVGQAIPVALQAVGEKGSETL